jgi:HTH-type transcriptional regulator, quorum sensing regulator NprR
LGQRIKYIRSIKKIKQAELAKGICSISYLSKIENENLNPSKEVEDSLLKRLGIYYDTKNYEQMLSDKINRWFNSISKENLESNREIYNKLAYEMNMCSHELIVVKFKVYSLKYFMEWEDSERVVELMEDLNQYKFMMTYNLLYYFEKFQGLFQYKGEELERSLEHLEAAKKYSGLIEIPPLEKAALYYSLGLNTGRLNKNQLSIDYTLRALAIFQASYQFKDCVNCHTLLGILYKRITNFTEAIEQYTKARELSKLAHYDDIMQTIEHNLGTLYSYINKPSLAIKCFKSSMDFKGKIENQFQTYLSLSKEYYKIGNLQEAENSLSAGKQLINSSVKISKVALAEYEILNRLYKKDVDYLDKIIFKELIPIFEEQKQSRIIADFLKYIGDYYYEEGKYKKSARYYSLSNKYLNQLLN